RPRSPRPSPAAPAGRSLCPSVHRRLAMALPRTLGELQLYRVLQRANLLGYYETFIQQGGDDVQQLCEAGEEEFLEIMALVGMATKPLHVRRLQKALREWASNPGLFSQPVSAVPVSSIPLFKLSEAGGRKALSNGHASPGEAAGGKGGGSAGTPPARSPTEPGEKLSTPESEGGGDEEPGVPPFSPGGSGGEQAAGTELEPELARTVAESVERLLQSCPRGGEAELRALMKLNKKLAKAVGHIFQLEDGDRQKEEEIRRHSAIYRRGEARSSSTGGAAQFCLRDNSLLLRRVELFSLFAHGRTGEHLPVLAQGGQVSPEPGNLPLVGLVGPEQSRPELLALPVGLEPPGAAYRASLEEDTAASPGRASTATCRVSGAAGACPRLTPPPGAAPDVPLGLAPHGLWSRHILQQTLMDEGLRLARLVSHERVGRLSPCLPGKPPGPEFEDGLAERVLRPPPSPLGAPSRWSRRPAGSEAPVAPPPPLTKQ
uniref:NGFI-A binding protein 2 n=1 Tax=Malurus cyaneus samueli TaxID=2593467 RepID=A0A8C5UBG0_9PASS